MTVKETLKEAEFNAYYAQYINQIQDGLSLVDALEQGKSFTVSFFESLTEDQLLYRYEQGKWTPKEVLLHLIDTERIFSYRALRFAREDRTQLPGFHQDDFVINSNANARSINSLTREYESVRESSLTLYASMDDNALAIIGQASGSPMSARAAAFITAGHEQHHIQIIKERYL